jgi:hypothetical protein
MRARESTRPKVEAGDGHACNLGATHRYDTWSWFTPSKLSALLGCGPLAAARYEGRLSEVRVFERDVSPPQEHVDAPRRHGVEVEEREGEAAAPARTRVRLQARADERRRQRSTSTSVVILAMLIATNDDAEITWAAMKAKFMPASSRTPRMFSAVTRTTARMTHRACGGLGN